MAEEIIGSGIGEPTEENNGQKSLLPGFKSVCMRIGLAMIVVFVSRGAATIISAFISESSWVQELDYLGSYLLSAVISVIFLYAVPMTATALILKYPTKSAFKSIYSKPKYFGKAMAMFPAGYGIAIAVRLISMWIGSLFEGSVVGDSFNAASETLFAPDIPSAVVMFIQLAVIAPIAEEFWFRGMIMESLRPYGNGVAIFVSAILFGLTHSNFEQFFYATAIGIFLGYIAVSTQSIVITTIMHAIFNSVSGVLILLMSQSSVLEYLTALQNSQEGEVTPAVALYFIWMVLIMLLLIIGIFMAIFKFTKIRKYRVPKVQTEISAKRRWGIFFSRVTVVIMLLLAADSFTFCYIPSLIYGLITRAIQ